MLQVAAALIFENGKFLICQRPMGKTRRLLWEFAGGKAEPGESLRRAVVRECREELDIEISAGEKFAGTIYEYPDVTVNLTVFLCRITGGNIKALEHNALRWITPEEIENYDFCPADRDILEKIKSVYGKRPVNGGKE